MNRFTTSDGLSLAYTDRGSGTPLLCLPGLTRNGADFDPLVEDFGSELRILALDSRGRGESDHDPDPANYNVAVEARDALELLDHLGLKRAALFGTSRGGLLSMVMAAAARDRLIGVMMNDIGPVIEAAGLARIETYLGVRPAAPSLDLLAAATASQMRPQFPGVTADMWRVYLARTLRETPTGLELRYDPALRDAFLAQSAVEAPPDLWPFFDAMAGVPLALLRGANSDILSQATAEAMQARRPDMALTIVPDRGHVPFLDEPQARDAIRAFLGRLAP